MRKNKELAKKLESSEEEEASSDSHDDHIMRMISRIEKTRERRKLREKHFLKQSLSLNKQTQMRVYLLNPEISKASSQSGSIILPKQQDIGKTELDILTSRLIPSRGKIFKVGREVSQVDSFSEGFKSRNDRDSHSEAPRKASERINFTPKENSKNSILVPSFEPPRLRQDLSFEKRDRREESYIQENVDVLFQQPNHPLRKFTTVIGKNEYSENSEKLKYYPNSTNTVFNQTDDPVEKKMFLEDALPGVEAHKIIRRGSDAAELIKLHNYSPKKQTQTGEDAAYQVVSLVPVQTTGTDRQGKVSRESPQLPQLEETSHKELSFPRSVMGDKSDATHENKDKLSPYLDPVITRQKYNLSQTSMTKDKVSGSFSALEDLSYWRERVEREKLGFFQRVL